MLDLNFTMRLHDEKGMNNGVKISQRVRHLQTPEILTKPNGFDIGLYFVGFSRYCASVSKLVSHTHTHTHIVSNYEVMTMQRCILMIQRKTAFEKYCWKRRACWYPAGISVSLDIFIK